MVYMREDTAGPTSGRHVSVDEAARVLGLTVDAVRKRVQRGTIEHEKDPAGRVQIILDSPDNASTVRDESPDTTGLIAAKDETIEELRARVAFLERQLERHGDETERLHQIIGGLAQANTEQARTIRAIESPASYEPGEDAETVEEEPAEEPGVEDPGSAAEEHETENLDPGSAEHPQDAAEDEIRRQIRRQEQEEQWARWAEERWAAAQNQRRSWWSRVFGR